jgi:hypothetical protein
MIVIITMNIPSENNKMRRNFLTRVSGSFGGSQCSQKMTYSPPVRLTRSKAGKGRIMRIKSVKMLSAPRVTSCVTAWTHTPKQKS